MNGNMNGHIESNGTSQATPTPVKLLSLDGGGIKGVSSLMILEAIMDRVREIEVGNGSNLQSPRSPADYFDLAGGTSTGGLAALMMFRLKLSVAQTIKNYEDLSRQIFSPSIGSFSLSSLGTFGYYLGNIVLNIKAVFESSRYSEKPLISAIDKIVKDSGIPEGGDAPLLEDSRPKMLMCATLTDKGESIFFHSYTPPPDSTPVSSGVRSEDFFDDITIVQAARATSAAPTYLPEMEIKGNKFWDGGLLNNNPIDQVWDFRYDLAKSQKETPVVSCVLSLGTSWSKNIPATGYFLKRFFNTLSETISFATNTEAKHRDFERNIRRINERLPSDQQTAYFRFNVPTGTESISLDNWHRMDVLKDYTRKYLEEKETQLKIDHCAQVLARPNTMLQT